MSDYYIFALQLKYAPQVSLLGFSHGWMGRQHGWKGSSSVCEMSSVLCNFPSRFKSLMQ